MSRKSGWTIRKGNDEYEDREKEEKQDKKQDNEKDNDLDGSGHSAFTRAYQNGHAHYHQPQQHTISAPRATPPHTPPGARSQQTTGPRSVQQGLQNVAAVVLAKALAAPLAQGPPPCQACLRHTLSSSAPLRPCKGIGAQGLSTQPGRRGIGTP